MNKIRLYGIFLMSFFSAAVNAASLLQPQSYPKTGDDLNFVQKIKLQQASYAPWESEYDTDGHCISGCLYPGITIDEDLELSRIRTEQAQAQVQQYLSGQSQQIVSTTEPIKIISTVPNKINSVVPNSSAQQIANSVYQTINHPTPVRCTPLNSSIPMGQNMPLGAPLTGQIRITSGYGRRIHPVTGKQSTHWAVDMAAPVGTNVFTPASGKVVSVWSDSTCGNGLNIIHANGYETFYCHLSKVTVNNGETVEAGCKVAETGNTGRTTGPHLHYAIKKDGGAVDPTGFMNTKV